jgi:hypothetical protein
MVGRQAKGMGMAGDNNRTKNANYDQNLHDFQGSYFITPCLSQFSHLQLIHEGALKTTANDL